MSEPSVTEAHRAARRALPLMPDEIFSLWLDQAIDQYGWAPESSEWASVLRRRRMHFWRSLEWREERVGLRGCSFTADTRHAALGIARATFTDAENGHSELAHRYSQRLRRLVSAAKRTKTVPGALVCVRMPDGALDVVDGIIRLAALLHLYRQGETRAFARSWVGAIPETIRRSV